MTEKKQSKRDRVEQEWGAASRKRAAALYMPPYDTTWADDLEWLRCYAARRLATRYPLLDALSKLELRKETFEGSADLMLRAQVGARQEWCATVRIDRFDKSIHTNPAPNWLCRIDEWIHEFERRLADMVNH